MVEYQDRSILAQMGVPDMKLPIQVALGYPNRLHQGPEAVDFVTLGSLHFESPDTERFPCLALAYEAGRQGGMSPIAFNAANEIAVQRYREHLSLIHIYIAHGACQREYLAFGAGILPFPHN